MSVEATVMCNCWKDGRATKPPMPLEWLLFEEGSTPRLCEDYDTEENSQKLGDWLESACEHPWMEYAGEFIASGTDYQAFLGMLGHIGWDQFPMLNTELPEGNGGTTSVAAAARALKELAYFRSLETLPYAYLADLSTGEDLSWNAVFYGFCLCLGEANKGGVEDGLDRGEYYVQDSRTGTDLFRSTRFRQRRLGGGKFELLDLATGKRFRHPKGVAGRPVPWPDGGLTNDEGHYRFTFPDELHVAVREMKPGLFDRIVNSLETVFQASVETGNPVEWC